MGNESSNDRSCDVDSNDLCNDHYLVVVFTTTHDKNEAAALDRAESFEPAESDDMSSVVQSVMDAYTLTHADKNIAEGCGKCNKKKDDESSLQE